MKIVPITELMLADFARSGLTKDDAKLLQITTTHTLKPNNAGYVIPYFSSSGKKTKFYRVRFVESTLAGFSAITGKKPLRYTQPPSTVNEVYLPPYIDWKEYLRGNLPIIFTEGEKKSAAATRAGLPTIGLGGVWCFMSKKITAPLLPIFSEINLKDREVYICFDSDAATNPDILMAEAMFAQRLTEQGACVFIARIPPRKNRKVGIDDYILEYDAHKFKRNVLNRAFEYSASKELHLLNAELVYLRSVGIIYDYKHEMRIAPFAFAQHTHSNIFINSTTTDKDGNVKMVRKSAAKMWLEWEHRAELHGITYSPGQPTVIDDSLNMWKGWGPEEAVKGDVTPWHQLLDVLFMRTDPAARKWFEQWCAYPIQHPGAKMTSAVVMWGVSQGTGKTLCGHTLMKLYGHNASEVKDSDLEDASFTWAENKQFILADDITGQNNRKLANMFKTMITQKTIHINQKYVPKYSIPDCINYYFTSNDPDAFYLDNKDRRFFIHEVLTDTLPEDLRKRFVKWRDSAEGISALFYYMLNLNLSGFDPQSPAMYTAAKQEMMHIGKSDLGAFVDRLYHEPDAVLTNKMKGDLYTAEALHVLYDPLETKRASANALARELKRAGFYKIQNPSGGAVHIGGRQLRLYAVRNVEKWKTATIKTVQEHYTETHLMKKEKFQ